MTIREVWCALFLFYTKNGNVFVAIDLLFLVLKWQTFENEFCTFFKMIPLLSRGKLRKKRICESDDVMRSVGRN